LIKGNEIGRLITLISIFVLFFFLITDPFAHAAEKEKSASLTKYLSLGIKAEYLFNSHTSFEFGNPFPPYQAPLSRLEFPLDSLWGGIELRFSHPRFSISGELLTNAIGDTNGRFKDSDWDDASNPTLKTIYSESSCRMEKSYMAKIDIDLEVSDWLKLPEWFSLRPVTGFRYQDFRMMTHDGIQFEPYSGTPPLDMPGNGIHFKQTYWQYFIGIRSNMDMEKLARLPATTLLMQLDWAYVEGSNEDHHLLRIGRRFTYEKTYGDAWHASVGLKKGLTKNLVLGFELDYLQIITKGNHRLVNEPLRIDFSFSNGVKVWSEQTNISLSIAYMF